MADNDNMTSTSMPFVSKPKKNAVSPINEEQLKRNKINLPSLEIKHHKKTSLDMPETLISPTQNNTYSSSKNRRETSDFQPKSGKKSQKSPLKSRKKFSIENYEGTLDSFGYPILKGGKKHRISFKEDIAKVIKVDNWKLLNIDSSYDSRKNCLCKQCKIM